MSARRIVTAVSLGALLALGIAAPVDAASKRPSAKAWAGDVCTAFLDFGDAVEQTLTGLQGTGSADAAADAAKQGVQAAADDLQQTLDGLGKPSTPNAAKARSALQTLGTELEKDVAEVQQALTPPPSSASEIASAFASIGSTTRKAVNQAKSTATTLQGLTGDGQLKQAFQQASSCKQLKSDLSPDL